MDEMNTTPPNGEQKSRFGLVAAIIALVAIVALGPLAYQALAPQAGRQPDAPAAQADETDAGASTGDADAGAEDESGDEGSNSRDVYLEMLDSEVSTESGTRMWLSEIANGRPLVVNFWATWCPYCVQEMGDFQALFNTYGDRVAFAFVDVADGARETVEVASAWLHDNGYDLPAYYDTEFNAVDTFAVTGYPTTVVFDADGRVVYAASGPINPDYMRGLLGSLVGA